MEIKVLLVGISAETGAILNEIFAEDKVEFVTSGNGIAGCITKAGTICPDGIPSLVLGEAETGSNKTLALPARISDIADWVCRFVISPAATSIHLGENLELDSAALVLRNLVTQETTQLTEKEAKLAEFLAKTGASPRDELLDKIWGYSEDMETRTVETHINRLRRKMESASSDRVTITFGEGGYSLESK